MSMAIGTENGTCPCKCCQRSIYLTPAQRELKKMAKLGLGMGDNVPKQQQKTRMVLPTAEQLDLLRQAREQLPVWDAEKPEGAEDS